MEVVLQRSIHACTPVTTAVIYSNMNTFSHGPKPHTAELQGAYQQFFEGLAKTYYNQDEAFKTFPQVRDAVLLFWSGGMPLSAEMRTDTANIVNRIFDKQPFEKTAYLGMLFNGLRSFVYSGAAAHNPSLIEDVHSGCHVLRGQIAHEITPRDDLFSALGAKDKCEQARLRTLGYGILGNEQLRLRSKTGRYMARVLCERNFRRSTRQTAIYI